MNSAKYLSLVDGMVALGLLGSHADAIIQPLEGTVNNNGILSVSVVPGDTCSEVDAWTCDLVHQGRGEQPNKGKKRRIRWGGDLKADEATLRTIRAKAAMTEPEAALLAGRSPKSMKNLRIDGMIPRKIFHQKQKHSKVIYITKLLIAWIEAAGMPAEKKKGRN